MPVIKLLEKIKTGYRQLFPETVGTAVITATGNAQDDISSLQSKIMKLEKQNELVEIDLDKDKFTNEENMTKLYECYMNKQTAKVKNFGFKTYPLVHSTEGTLMFKYVGGEYEQVICVFTPLALAWSEIERVEVSIFLKKMIGGGDGEESSIIDIPFTDIEFYNTYECTWKYYGGYQKLRGKTENLSMTANANKYYKLTDFDSSYTLDCSIFKELLLEVDLTFSDSSERRRGLLKILRNTDSDKIVYKNSAGGLVTVYFRGSFYNGGFLNWSMTISGNTVPLSNIWVNIVSVRGVYY